MPYTKDESGVLNNYPVETKDTVSDYPSPQTQRLYLIGGIAALLLIGTIVWIAIAVS